MATEAVQVVSPSRLHFGLLSFGQPDGRQFGGVGAMIESPGVRIRLARDANFEVEGPCSGRVEQLACRWSQQRRDGELPACRIHVDELPSAHVGLGSGTQLALAVSRGLDELFALPPAEPAELASSVGRGLRSAVGTYGFAYGGLIAERGKLPGEPLAPLQQRIVIPASWRFVLVRHCQSAGLSGDAEKTAFQTMEPVPSVVTCQLEEELNQCLVPALESHDLPAFGESVYRYGKLAGSCFAQFQEGPFATRRIEQLVERVRSWGVNGVGQSSWGPTVFAVTADNDEAGQLCDQIRACYGSEIEDLRISAGNNTGARVDRVSAVPSVAGA